MFPERHARPFVQAHMGLHTRANTLLACIHALTITHPRQANRNPTSTGSGFSPLDLSSELNHFTCKSHQEFSSGSLDVAGKLSPPRTPGPVLTLGWKSPGPTARAVCGIGGLGPLWGSGACAPSADDFDIRKTWVRILPLPLHDLGANYLTTLNLSVLTCKTGFDRIKGDHVCECLTEYLPRRRRQ